MTTYLFTDPKGYEYCSNIYPEWDEELETWNCLTEGVDGNYEDQQVRLPKGTIEKIIGEKLTYPNISIL